MELPILDKEDNWRFIYDKLDEELREVEAEIKDEEVNKEEVAGELLDLMQVVFGAFDKLEGEGLDLDRAFTLHRLKLRGRDWDIKYLYEIIKKRKE